MPSPDADIGVGDGISKAANSEVAQPETLDAASQVSGSSANMSAETLLGFLRDEEAPSTDHVGLQLPEQNPRRPSPSGVLPDGAGAGPLDDAPSDRFFTSGGGLETLGGDERLGITLEGRAGFASKGRSNFQGSSGSRRGEPDQAAGAASRGGGLEGAGEGFSARAETLVGGSGGEPETVAGDERILAGVGPARSDFEVVRKSFGMDQSEQGGRDAKTMVAMFSRTSNSQKNTARGTTARDGQADGLELETSGPNPRSNSGPSATKRDVPKHDGFRQTARRSGSWPDHDAIPVSASNGSFDNMPTSGAGNNPHPSSSNTSRAGSGALGLVKGPSGALSALLGSSASVHDLGFPGPSGAGSTGGARSSQDLTGFTREGWAGADVNPHASGEPPGSAGGELGNGSWWDGDATEGFQDGNDGGNLARSIDRTPAPVLSPLAERLAAEVRSSQDGGHMGASAGDAASRPVAPHIAPSSDTMAARSRFLTGIPSAGAGPVPIQETPPAGADGGNAERLCTGMGYHGAFEGLGSRSGPEARPREGSLHGLRNGEDFPGAPATPPRLPNEDRRLRAGEEVSRSPFVLGDRGQSRSVSGTEAWGSLRSPRGAPLDLNSRTSGSLRTLSVAPLELNSGKSGSLRTLSGAPLELSGRHSSIHEQMSASLRLEVRTMLASGSINRSFCWGWLEPGPGLRMLPRITLEGAGVAIGRGPEAFLEARRAPAPAANGAAAPIPTLEQAMSGDLGTALSARWNAMGKGLNFVAVADGRVSRLHCTIRAEGMRSVDVSSANSGSTPQVAPQARLEDHSSNGTFVNGVKVPRPGGVILHEGDRISLVQSVSPLVEQYFLYHADDPRGLGQEVELEGFGRSPSLTRKTSLPFAALTGLASGSSGSGAGPNGAPASPSPRRRLSFKLQRMMTSRYTTAEASTLDDLQCQICLGTLESCVALEPCGHNFCAACLSNHFAAQLQGGVAISCPLRCPSPVRVVANTAVRFLVTAYACNARSNHSSELGSRGHWANFSTSRPLAEDSETLPEGVSSGGDAGHAELAEEEDEGEGELPQMSPICPLYDEELPMDAATLKTRQLAVAVQRLKQDGLEPEATMTSLEAVARLAWSDDGARQEVADLGGIPLIIAAMRRNPGQEGVQCNACLALMALVRGEGPVCQANQIKVAQANGVEAIVEAMRAWAGQAMVQLSALLAMIPLALENMELQALLAAQALPEVMRALASHPGEADVQAKGLVVLGVLGQGDEEEHDAIRSRELESGAPAAIATALATYGGHEEVLWAALFSLAVLVRDGDPQPQAARAIVVAGLLPLLRTAMAAYQEANQGREDAGDEMITTAAQYLIQTLEPIARHMRWEAWLKYGLAVVPLAGAVLGIAGLHYIRGS